MKRSALDLGLDVESLGRMSLAELRALWPSVTGRGAPPPGVNCRVLMRELAWRIQERRSGGLDPETAGLLNAAVHKQMKRWARGGSTHVPADDGVPLGGRSDDRASRPSDSTARRSQRRLADDLPASARLVRVYGGSKHEVLVLDGGKSFLYRGTTYRSLTAIAQLIAGGTRSGPRFFGLTTRPRGRAEPREGDTR